MPLGLPHEFLGFKWQFLNFNFRLVIVSHFLTQVHDIQFKKSFEKDYESLYGSNIFPEVLTEAFLPISPSTPVENQALHSRALKCNAFYPI